MVLGKLRHVKQWPNQSSYTSNHLIAKRDEYPCHAKQWPTPTSAEGHMVGIGQLTKESIQISSQLWKASCCFQIPHWNPAILMC